MSLKDLRADYHRQICHDIIHLRANNAGDQFPNFADSSSRSSRSIACEVIRRLPYALRQTEVSEQTAGRSFEQATRLFLERAFGSLDHLRPGPWSYSAHPVTAFAQYAHLADLEKAISASRELASALGREYVVHPDIVVGRRPVSDADINSRALLLDENGELARLTPFRAANSGTTHPILHACISCKWTIRSDRAQNVRTEPLGLVRHRKGHLPHVVAVTAEPLPTRIAALALGTGDLDCVYHFALCELQAAVSTSDNDDQMEMLDMLVDGQRLRDISDLPFDLAA